MSGRLAGLALLVAALGVAAPAPAQNLGGMGNAGRVGGATIQSPAVGFTSVGVPAAVGPVGWGWPYGGYGPIYGGYGYPPYGYPGYAYPAYTYPSTYLGVFNPVPPFPPEARMGNNLGGVMSAIQGSTGRGRGRR